MIKTKWVLTITLTTKSESQGRYIAKHKSKLTITNLKSHNQDQNKGQGVAHSGEMHKVTDCSQTGFK